MTRDKTERKERPVATGVLDYFPDAIADVANVSFVGNQQHNPGQPMHWAKHKSTDHADCIARHMLERGKLDTDGLRHSAKAAWRALAMLQIEIESEQTDFVSKYPRPFEFGGMNDDFARYLNAGCSEDVALALVKGTTYVGDERNCPYVYVAGPMRGYDKFNFPAFDQCRDRLLDKGFNVISPADIDRHAGCNEDTPVAAVEDQTPFVFRDFHALLFLKRQSHPLNGVALLDGWTRSTGATGEFGVARWLKLKFYDQFGDQYFSGVGECPPNWSLSERRKPEESYTP